MKRVTELRHIVLDLDGTLIGEDYICARPHLGTFLAFCFEHFDTVNIWTAASQSWFDQCFRKIILKHMPESNPQFHCVWFGDKCKRRYDSELNYHVTYKPLSRYWRAKSRGMTKCNTVILDNTPETYLHNYGNAVPVETYLGSSRDDELLWVINLFRGKIFYGL